MSDATETVEKKTRAKSSEKTATDIRIKHIPVWVDNQIGQLESAFVEGYKMLYAAAVVSFSELTTEEQAAKLAQAKLLHAKYAKGEVS